MQLKATMKVVNLFMALAAFLTVGVISLLNGDDLLWVVAKAVGSFAACWIVLGYLVTILCVAVEGPQAPEVSGASNDAPAKRKKGKKE